MCAHCSCAFWLMLHSKWWCCHVSVFLFYFCTPCSVIASLCWCFSFRSSIAQNAKLYHGCSQGHETKYILNISLHLDQYWIDIGSNCEKLKFIFHRKHFAPLCFSSLKSNILLPIHLVFQLIFLWYLTFECRELNFLQGHRPVRCLMQRVCWRSLTLVFTFSPSIL